MSKLARARILLMQQRWDLAEQQLRDCLSEAPEDSQALQLLTHALVGQKKPSEAISVARDAVRVAPESGHSHLALSYALEADMQLADAEEAARAAEQLDPTNPDYLCQRAELQYRQLHNGEALETARRGLAIDAQHLGCLLISGAALRAMGRVKESREAFHAVLAIQPEEPNAHFQMGQLELDSNDPAMAEEFIRNSLRLLPTLEGAEEGLFEAIASRSPVYRVLMRGVTRFERLGDIGRVVALFGFLGLIFVVVITGTKWADARFGDGSDSIFMLLFLGCIVGFNVLAWLTGYRALARDRTAKHLLTPGMHFATRAIVIAIVAGPITPFFLWRNDHILSIVPSILPLGWAVAGVYSAQFPTDRERWQFRMLLRIGNVAILSACTIFAFRSNKLTTLDRWLFAAAFAALLLAWWYVERALRRLESAHA